MKILHVLEAVEGGTALHVRHLASSQAGRHAVAVAVPARRSWGRTDSTFSADLRAAGVEVHEVAMRRNPAHPTNAVAAIELVRLVRRWRPDIVHTHSTAGGALGRVVARITGVPTVHTQNGATFADAESGVSGLAGRSLESLLGRFSDAVIAVSESEAAALREVHPRRRVVTIPNGIPASAEQPRPMPDPPVVVSVCRFVFQKEPLLAVRVMAAACQLVPGARALLVGYGEQEAEVRALIAQLDPAIEVRADIPGPDALAGATVALLCSRFEGAPYVLLEAMERSRPVVATDVVGSRDAVADGTTGTLFPFGDVDAGAAAVARLLADPKLAAAMGAAGRVRLEEHFTVAVMAARVEEVYDAALVRR